MTKKKDFEFDLDQVFKTDNKKYQTTFITTEIGGQYVSLPIRTLKTDNMSKLMPDIAQQVGMMVLKQNGFAISSSFEEAQECADERNRDAHWDRAMSRMGTTGRYF